MSAMPRDTYSDPDLTTPVDGEGSVVRSREQATPSGRPRAESSAQLKAERGPRPRDSSAELVTGSLDERLERKMRAAGELVRHLPPTDSRVRLLYIAVMRRDESLLDGVIAELNKQAQSG
jgi:hypothetical protein